MDAGSWGTVFHLVFLDADVETIARGKVDGFYLSGESAIIKSKVRKKWPNSGTG
jgi:hypothetical protein